MLQNSAKAVKLDFTISLQLYLELNLANYLSELVPS